MTGYYVLTGMILFIGAFLVIVAAMVIASPKYTHWEIPGVLGIVFLGFGFGLFNSLDKVTAREADNFFVTRKDAYSCELPDGYACKLKIKNWRSDSVYWDKKVKEILEDN